jgi:hypothetical protein
MGRVDQTKPLVLLWPRGRGCVRDEILGANAWNSRGFVGDACILPPKDRGFRLGRAGRQGGCAQNGRQSNLTVDSKNQHSEPQ